MLALFFGCLTIGALNETINVLRDPENAGNWKPKAVAGVAVLIFATFTAYFWRKSVKEQR